MTRRGSDTTTSPSNKEHGMQPLGGATIAADAITSSMIAR